MILADARRIGLRGPTARARGAARGRGGRRRRARTLLPRRRRSGHRENPAGGGARSGGGLARWHRPLVTVLGRRGCASLLAVGTGPPGASPERSRGAAPR